MCGIVGIITRNALSYRAAKNRFFSEALAADTFRGHHSTGVVKIDQDGSYEWRKAIMPGWEFIEDKKYTKFLSLEKDTSAMFGHNRWATMGAHDDVSCAHPFDHENVVGVHNGSIQNWDDILPDEYGKKYTVDSDAIFAFISEHGIDELLKLGLDGGFVFVWWDKKEEKIKIIRNTKRPLASFYDTGTIGFASELDMLKWVANRGSNSLYVPPKAFAEVKSSVLVTIDPQTLDVQAESKKIAPPKYNSYYNWRDDYWNDYSYKSTANYPKYGHHAAKDFNVDPSKKITFSVKEEDYVQDYGHFGTVRTVASNGYDVSIPSVSPTEFESMLNKKFTMVPDHWRTEFEEYTDNNDRTQKAEVLVQIIYRPAVERQIKEGKFQSIEKETVDTTANKSLGNISSIVRYVGPRGVVEDAKDFLRRFEHGCNCCGKKINPHNREEFGFYPEDIQLEDGGVQEQDYLLCTDCLNYFHEDDKVIKQLEA